MVFSSATFLFFFLPCVLGLYYLSPMRVRNALLLLASLVFYAWGEPVYVFLMIGSIAVNWLIGLLMARFADTPREKMVLALGIAFDLVVLAYFKYAGFFAASVLAHVPGLEHTAAQFHAPRLPIGISFFTFHAMSYLVDIYRRQARALRNPLNMGVYITMFPQLIAGPIIRFHDVAEQILRRRNTLGRFASGVERFSYGLGKKMLIANPLGAVADSAFGMDPPIPAHRRRLGRHRLLCAADLLRLRRLLRHGHRPWQDAGFRVPRELQLPIHRFDGPGILAPLAPVVVGVVSGLPVYPARR